MKALKQAKLWAERKIGELLIVMEKAKGGQPYQKSTGRASRIVRFSTYAELGIEKKQAHRLQGEIQMVLFGTIRGPLKLWPT